MVSYKENTMDKLVVERSIWISASREHVWQPVTNPEKVVQWFVPNLPGAEMQRDDSGKITVHMGSMGIGFAMMEIVEPQRQVNIRSLPDQLITVRYTLDDQKGGTQVTVTAYGFESLPQEDRDDRIKLSGSGWEQALKNLKGYIDGVELPFPQAYTGPLFGYWRVPQEKIGIERSIWIEASCERVWKAVSDCHDQFQGQWRFASEFSPGHHRGYLHTAFCHTGRGGKDSAPHRQHEQYFRGVDTQ